MKRTLGIVLATVLAASVTGCGTSKPAETTGAATQAVDTAKEAETGSESEAAESEAPAELVEVVVGASPAPHAEILEAAVSAMEAKGYKLVVKEYTDYVQPNLALDHGDLDANYFQHLPYLEQFCEENGTKLVSAAAIHYEPFGIYAGKTSDLESLPDKAKVAVPNDATNEARALLLLEAQEIGRAHV